jgi:dihydroneopterin aldolase
MTNLDSIYLDDLEVDCVIGAHPEERNCLQRLRIQAELGVNTQPAASTDHLQDTVDYESVAAQIAFVLRASRFRLLETAAHAACSTLLLPPIDGEHQACVERVRLRVTKLDGLRARATPAVEVQRHASDAVFLSERRPFGEVEIVHETSDLRICRMKIDPRGIVQLHSHQLHQDAEMLLTHGLAVQGTLGSCGNVYQWPRQFSHCYENPTSQTQGILSIRHPVVSLQDEVATTGDALPIAAVTAWTLEPLPYLRG